VLLVYICDSPSVGSTNICVDPKLSSVTREQIIEALEKVGFTSTMQSASVGSLSGGWKMKLELARAMLMNADILLLDEPTNHLDVTNVKWLEDYLNSQDKVTSIIVSHDSVSTCSCVFWGAGF
jgi:elongation factor 3